MKLNEKLIKLRKEKGLSQEEFGNEINVSRQAISKWEAGTTKPDIEKLKEISNYFNVSYDYLLNDEFNNVEDVPKKAITPKKKHTILKILIAILIIYLLVCIYKFIVLFRFYKIADSFSENKYWMSQNWKSTNESTNLYSMTQKIGNQIIISNSNDIFDKAPLVDENGSIIPYHIEFYDYDKKIAYTLVHDHETNMYYYMNNIENFQTEEDWQKLFATGQIIKDNTFSFIPSDFKSILLSSINPLCYVSLKDRIIFNNFLQGKNRILLNQDCLIWTYDMKTEFDGGMGITYSYNYVQDHFEDSIPDPAITYKDKISNYSEIEHLK